MRFFSLCLFFFMGLFSQEINFDFLQKKRPFITTNSIGELGNGLFRSAMGISCAIDEGYHFLVNKRYYKIYPEIFSRLTPLPRHMRPETSMYIDFLNSLNMKVKKNCMLKGYPQTHLFFHHNRDAIVSIFSPTEEFLDHLNRKFQEILKHKDEYIAVHLRTFHRGHDMVTYSDPKFRPHSPLSYKYYDQVFEHFGRDTTYVIFSDSIDAAKIILKRYNCKFIFMNQSSLQEDFYLMTLFKNLVISNSTFSWWSAYLNKRPNNKIITPWPWFRQKETNWIYNGKHAICPPEWIEFHQGDEHSYDFVNAINNG